jgi:hypothetical protein
MGGPLVEVSGKYGRYFKILETKKVGMIGTERGGLSK